MSGQQNWQTPRDLFALLDYEFAFEFDLAASPGDALVDRYAMGPCQAAEIGAASCGCGIHYVPAGAASIFCNPPYAEVDPWIEQFARLGRMGYTVAALLQPKTDAAWFTAAAASASEIRLMRGRVQFIDPDTGARGKNSNNYGSILAVWRPFHRPPAAHIWVWDWRATLAELVAEGVIRG